MLLSSAAQHPQGAIKLKLKGAAATKVVGKFVISGDPLKAGLVASFNRPGGNVTGITLLTSAMEAKRLGLLRELVPNATSIGMLVNTNYPTSEVQVNDAQEASRTLGLLIHIVTASAERDFDGSFATMVLSKSERLSSVTIRSSLPTAISSSRLRSATRFQRSTLSGSFLMSAAC